MIIKPWRDSESTSLISCEHNGLYIELAYTFKGIELAISGDKHYLACINVKDCEKALVELKEKHVTKLEELKEFLRLMEAKIEDKPEPVKEVE